MEIKVTVELGEKTFGILEKLFGRIEPVSTAPEVKVEWVGGSQGTAAAPVATQPAQAAAVPTQPTTAVSTAATVPTQPATAVPTAVPTAAAPVYTIESLSAAASTIIDDPTKYAQLQALMQSHGVNALTEIPQAKYPEIAFALRGMGANI